LSDPDLPRKHNKGGQSSNRFARLRVEKRDAYTKKLAEKLTSAYIDPETHKVNVESIVFAGFGDVKSHLAKCDELDPRIAKKIAKLVDIQYGGDAGLSEALSRANEFLQELQSSSERNVVSSFMSELATDTGMACFGETDVFFALDGGAVKTLILWDSLPMVRCTLRNKDTGASKVAYAQSEAKIADLLKPLEGHSMSEWELVEHEPLLDWLVAHHHDFGAEIRLVSNETAEGSQFAAGFGGLGAQLRYRVTDLPSMAIGENEDDTILDSDGEEYDFDF
jgi:peptide chain release factor subunit 1